MHLELDTTEPQREPLSFVIEFDGIPEQYKNLAYNIKQVAENVLYHWKTFPIVLPSPVVILHSNDSSKKKTLRLQDAFVSPSFDELDSVALDSKGETQRLSYQQLNSIRKYGEFDVESINFPGHSHRWRLSHLLQKGSHCAQESLLNDLALALRFILITGRNRLASHFFSVTSSFLSFKQGLVQFVDVLLGMPTLLTKDIKEKLREERSKHLVAELIVQPDFDDELETFCQFIKQQIHKQKMEKYQIEHEAVPTFPYQYQTPKGVTIDLRLFNRELMKKLLPILISILEREARGWFFQYKEKIISALKSKGLPDNEIEKETNILVMDEYIRRLHEAIEHNAEIETIGHEIGKLLMGQVSSVVMIHRSIENLRNHLKCSRVKLKQELETMHPILSRIGPWLRKELRLAEEKLLSERKWSAHEEAIALCMKHNLKEMTYFLQRDLVFLRETEPVLSNELSRVKIPMRTFQWRSSIWFPQHWKIRKVYLGQSEIVPTVINKMGTPLTAARTNPNEPVFLVEKQVTQTTSTRWPFWRLVNYCQRTWVWLWNVMFLLGVAIPWCSLISLRALFTFAPFMPDWEPSENGNLIPRRASVTPTLCSRLISLWRHISKSRTEFESRPDRGFIGKGVTRHANRAWNYLVKGFLGTLVLVLLFPLVCIGTSLLSLCAAVTAVLWLPIATFLFYLFCVTIYDFDCADPARNKWFTILESLVWKIFIQGCVQPICALFLAIVVCPILYTSILIFGLFRRGLRLLWDVAMFHIVIKKKGRVPACDSLLVKRVAGPGLNNDYYYQIEPEQALAAIEAKMELDELNAFKDQMERMIKKPQLLYNEFVKLCFQPFSTILVKEGVYSQLEKEANDLCLNLKEKVDRRKIDLHLGLGITVKAKVRMISLSLKQTLKVAATLSEKFYPVHVFSRLQTEESEFWEGRSLSYRDWPGLGRQLLVELFSQEILIPLDESDVRFHLGIQNVNLSPYVDMLRASYSVDGDFVNILTTRKGNVRIHSPYVDASFFNPLWKKEVTYRKQTEQRKLTISPWKKSRTPFYKEWLTVPLPIPHPVEIALIVYNREADAPICMDGESAARILGFVEEAIVVTDLQLTKVTLIDRDHSHNENFESNGAGGRDSFGGDYEDVSSRSNRDSVMINLASLEDITLEPDGERVTYSHNSYGTTV